MTLPVKQIAVLVLAVFMLVSCTKESVKKEPPPRPPKPSKKFTSTTSEKPSAATEARRQVREMVRNGEYEAALVKIRDVSGSSPIGKDYAVLHQNALDGLILRGDSYMENRDYAQAGSAYRAALDNYPENEDARQKMERSAEDLKHSIDICAGVLMEDGLRKYRAGELEAAIAIWDTIISFDPDNAAAIKARDTANTQLQNLRKLN